MTMQVIDISLIRKCHVVETGDDAGYPIYETETAYEAGTLVYDSTAGVFWCSIVDIEATDTDTPLDAPDKWAFVPIKTLS